MRVADNDSISTSVYDTRYREQAYPGTEAAMLEFATSAGGPAVLEVGAEREPVFQSGVRAAALTGAAGTKHRPAENRQDTRTPPLKTPRGDGATIRQPTIPGVLMKIALSSVIVDDQDKALKFYTEVLGFVKKTDIPLGTFKWLTVVSPDGPDDIELLLEPNENPAAKMYQKALFDQGIPLTAFAVADIHADFARLKTHGVAFRGEPTQMGPVTVVVFDDTCGNLIQLYQA